jgi:hypothetical protein
MVAGMGHTRYLYLGLSLACFAGILGIFIVDGYLGVYDILYITYDEYEREIEFDNQWVPESEGAYYGGEIAFGKPAYFRYQIENRTFSSYEDRLTVSVWEGGNKLVDLVDKQVKITSFGSAVVEWTLTSDELATSVINEEYSNYTIRISSSSRERKVIFGYRVRSIIPPPPVPLK